jgi:hypothetical protein
VHIQYKCNFLKNIFEVWLVEPMDTEGQLSVVNKPDSFSSFASCPSVSKPHFLVYNQLSPPSKLFFYGWVFCSLSFSLLPWLLHDDISQIRSLLFFFSVILSKTSTFLIFYPLPKSSFFAARKTFYFIPEFYFHIIDVLGVHCDIYKSFYNISSWNLPPSSFSFLNFTRFWY